MTDDEAMQLFDQVFRAERNLAICAEALERKKAELQQAEEDLKQAEQGVNAAMARVRSRAKEVAGVPRRIEDEPMPQRPFGEFVPVRR